MSQLKWIQSWECVYLNTLEDCVLQFSFDFICRYVISIVVSNLNPVINTSVVLFVVLITAHYLNGVVFTPSL
jgi:hypothetical protein